MNDNATTRFGGKSFYQQKSVHLTWWMQKRFPDNQGSGEVTMARALHYSAAAAVLAVFECI